MIHTNKSEVFELSIHEGFKYATCPAHGTICYHGRLAAHSISHLVMITNVTDRISFRVAILDDSNNNAAVA